MTNGPMQLIKGVIFILLCLGFAAIFSSKQQEEWFSSRAIDHGAWGRLLLTKMNNRVKLKGFEGFRKEFKITDVKLNVTAWERLPTMKLVVDGRDWRDGVQTKLVVKEVMHQAFNDGNFIIFAGKESTVAITTNSHDSLRLGGFIVYLVRVGPRLWSKLSIWT